MFRKRGPISYLAPPPRRTPLGGLIDVFRYGTPDSTATFAVDLVHFDAVLSPKQSMAVHAGSLQLQTHLQYATLTARSHERPLVLRCTYAVCLVSFINATYWVNI